MEQLEKLELYEVGTTVYHTQLYVFPMVHKCIVKDFLIKNDGIYAVLDVYVGKHLFPRHAAVHINRFGKDIFYTREQAEKALKDLNVSS